MNIEQLTDRELMRMAAKAAGMPLSVDWDCAADGHGILIYREDGSHFSWNPLGDDGDALRLAVQLRMGISLPVHKAIKADVVVFTDSSVSAIEYGSDPYAAARRAITRAAAMIGAKMP